MSTIGKNLQRIRKLRGFTQADLARRSGVSQQLISQLERGVNKKTKELPDLAQALDAAVSEIDPAYSSTTDGMLVIRVPIVAWVSAGAMLKDDMIDEAKGDLLVGDLAPGGDWIALEVQGDSMDRISPPGSIILLNRRDKALVPNACYVIDDGEGNATYKRYRSDPMRFEPVSTNTTLAPVFPDNEPTVVGRVRRSILKM